MKKIIITSILLIIIGIIIGLKIPDVTQSLEDVFQTGKTYYFLQENIYTEQEALEENTKDIKVKIVEQENNKYYVYLGITQDIENAKKIKRLYEQKGYSIYIKERYLSNEEFETNLTQFDLLLKNTTNEKEILTITEVVLANYEEIIKAP